MMIEAIEKRQSIRKYVKKKLSTNDESLVLKIMKQVIAKKGPFGNKIKLSFYDSPYVDKEKTKKISTKNFIVDPGAFVVGWCKNDFENMIDFGYLFEELILELTSINLGTVWLSGTLNRDDFKGLIADGEVIPGITPVGYGAEKTSLRDHLIQRIVKARTRLPFDELFFDDKLNPVSENHKYAKYLELVRVGPSASNKQPWRVVVDGNEVHFYLKRTKGYGIHHPMDIQALDIGIAIYHFAAGLKNDDKKYSYKKKGYKGDGSLGIYVLTINIDE